MKRDMTLIRELLIKVEGVNEEIPVLQLKVDGYSHEQIAYNAYLLIEAGLAEGKTEPPVSDGNGGTRPTGKYLRNLTWQGHEFLDSVKNDAVWKKVLDYVQDKGGSAPFNSIALLAVSFAKEYFGLP